MRLLLISPRFPESFWSFRWAMAEVLPGKRTTNPPLGLATLAALSPGHWDITIVDENVEPVPLNPQADIVGICGMGVQYQRQQELLAYYRGRGYFVVCGGSYTSLCPEKYETLADTVVAGEAEYIWPQFCRDFEAGTPQPLYRETGTVALTDSPTPRFDLLKLDLYASVSLQYSRGCPYRCEFCDIIVMFGRRPRVKSLEQVGRELDALRALGMKRVFFVDDNLIGNRPQAKLLLGYLADYQRQHRYAFSFGTEASLNLAQDKELLGLFRAANFGWVFIGIESPDEDSLKETKKTQNTGQDILASVRKVYAYGIDVLAGFIVGFDHDTVDTFERQYRFIMESGIQAAMVGLLHAAPRTPLYERIKKEGRLLDEGDSCDNTRAATNIQPKNMALTTMVERYEQLYRRLVSDRAVAQRIRNKTRYLRAPSYVGGFSTRDSWLIAWRLLVRGILPGGPRRIVSFLRSLPWLAPRSFSLVLADWITGLSMAEFVRRHFSAEEQPSRTLEDRLGAIRRAFAHYLEAGKVSLSVGSGPAPELAIVLKDLLDGGFFQSAAPRLDRLLEHTRASLTLRIEAFHEHQRAHFDRLLRRLARHGDRIRIEVDETLRALVPIDSSVFNLALPGGNG